MLVPLFYDKKRIFPLLQGFGGSQGVEGFFEGTSSSPIPFFRGKLAVKTL